MHCTAKERMLSDCEENRHILASDGFIRTNDRGIAIMFARLSIWDKRAL